MSIHLQSYLERHTARYLSLLLSNIPLAEIFNVFDTLESVNRKTFFNKFHHNVFELTQRSSTNPSIPIYNDKKPAFFNFFLTSRKACSTGLKNCRINISNTSYTLLMMADDNEFLSRLIGFGLSEKEAILYFHLLKYGPKPPSLLAKSLKTYREDVHRTLTGLIDMGMVSPSLDSPTLYAAVELEIALEVALKKHETELREMEIRKRELEEISKRQHFRPSDEFSTFKIIKSLKEGIAVAMPALSTTVEEWITVCPAIFLVIASLYTIEDTKKFTDRGGKVRVITDVTYPYIESVQQHLDINVDVRHLAEYRGVMFSVFDRKVSTSAINVDINRISLDTSMSMIWTDDPTHAMYLVSTFELLWDQSVPAAERIQELSKEKPQYD